MNSHWNFAVERGWSAIEWKTQRDNLLYIVICVRFDRKLFFLEGVGGLFCYIVSHHGHKARLKKFDTIPESCCWNKPQFWVYEYDFCWNKANFGFTNMIFVEINPNFGFKNMIFVAINPNFGFTNMIFVAINPNFGFTNMIFVEINPNFGITNMIFVAINPNFGFTNMIFHLNMNKHYTNNIYT